MAAVASNNNKTICILLVAGHSELLEQEIEACDKYVQLESLPKALLPGVGGKCILDYWWDVINIRQLFNEVYLVTNANKYKHFERWATAANFEIDNIINDGSTTYRNRIGTIADVDLVLRVKKITATDAFVIAGDMLFQDDKFDLKQVLSYFKLKEDGNLAVYYEMDDDESTCTRGIVEVCPQTHRVTKFLEKPLPTDTLSRKASVVFYGFRADVLPTFGQYLSLQQDLNSRSFGRYMEWMVNERNVLFYGMKLPTGFQLIGQGIGLKDYEKWLAYFVEKEKGTKKGRITKKAYARVGLLGNPSDGFFGKTISLSIANFWATAMITESKRLRLIPHALNDPTEFGGLNDLYQITEKDGYLGGLRLLQASCKIFYQYCSKNGIALGRRNFTLQYDTNIPRQVGLAGSSAIVTATLKCLMEFYNLTKRDIPLEKLPQLILDAELQELSINAGLQDRVVQVYEGLIYMDFSRDMMQENGYGRYTRLNVEALPHLWLVYIGDPSDSGAIHSDVSSRWSNGDPDVIDGMQTFASYAEEARHVIEAGNWLRLSQLMNANFELRRKLYGEDTLGRHNMRMIEIGQEHGAAVKFPGSGGAVVGLCMNDTKLEALRKAYQEEGYVFVDIIPILRTTEP